MRIITEPTVTLLSWPQFQEHPKYKLPKNKASLVLQDTGETLQEDVLGLQGTSSEQLVAHAGKGCYDSYGEDGRAIADHIGTLVGSGHGSVLEHANVSIFIEGISRGCSHEIVRHRAGFAFSQRSTRYTAEDDAAIVLEPYFAELWKKYRPEYQGMINGITNCWSHTHGESWGITSQQEWTILSTFLIQCGIALDAYGETVMMLSSVAPQDKSKTEKRKWARGKARQLLPHALETRMTMTGNLRSWWHFLTARSSRHAEAEIRRLAAAIADNIMPLAPSVFRDFSYASEVVDGYPEFKPSTPKV